MSIDLILFIPHSDDIDERLAESTRCAKMAIGALEDDPPTVHKVI
jgi:hypothetical protein